MKLGATMEPDLALLFHGALGGVVVNLPSICVSVAQTLVARIETKATA